MLIHKICKQLLILRLLLVEAQLYLFAVSMVGPAAGSVEGLAACILIPILSRVQRKDYGLYPAQRGELLVYSM